jgi:hypothetical protein
MSVCLLAVLRAFRVTRVSDFWYSVFRSQDDEDDGKDSDAEFEQMLAEAEEISKDESGPSTPAPVKKAKTKIGGAKKKSKKKKLKTSRIDEDGNEIVSIQTSRVNISHILCSAVSDA